MDISQKDRDSLRTKQQALRPPFSIGNIIEHKIQDPAKYKAMSRQEQGLSVDAQPGLPKLNYKSKYLKEQQNDHCDHSDHTASSAQTQADMPEGEAEANEAAIVPTTCSPFDEHNSDPWLNMDKIEHDKLEWMSERADQAFLEKLQTSTHFDREGRAMAPGTVMNVDRDNPVHDIESLVKLLESTFQPHITYSLNVISKIASRATRGIYDSVFDENIHQVLINRCLLRVRRHIDSSNETTCLAALKCIRSLICNTQVDEIFLDKLCPLRSEECDATTWLNTDQGDFDIDLKDNDCVQIDAILTLLTRTDLFTRLSYLFKTKLEAKYKQAYQDCILDILIRVARHSRGSCWMLSSLEFPDLLIKECLPSNIINETKLTQSLALRTLKLLRILSTAAFEVRTLTQGDDSLTIKLPLAIERNILDYYHIDCYNSVQQNDDLTFHLHIETLRLMESLISLENFPKLMFNIMSMDQALLVANLKVLAKFDATQRIESQNSLDWQYAASLFNLLGRMVNYEKYNIKGRLMESHWNTFIVPITLRWWNDLVRSHLVPHQDVSIAIASAIQHFDKCNDDSLGNHAYSLLLKVSQEKASHSTATYYRMLMKEAANNSRLGDILETNGRLRDPVMLPSYGFLDLNISKESIFNINGYFETTTPSILLKALIDALQKNMHTYRDAFIDQDHDRDLILYLKEITRYYTKSTEFERTVQGSLIAQQEICTLSKSLIMFVDNSPLLETDKNHDICIESYSNILLDAVALIGLMNPSSENMASLKDKLIEKVVFDGAIHRKLYDECLLDTRHKEISCKFDIRHAGEGNREFLKLSRAEIDDPQILKPIYMNCGHSNRFWLFQPIIEYYKSLLRDDNKDDKMRRDAAGKWFAENMTDGTTDYHREICNDCDVIAAILRLHATLMECSPAFVETAVTENIEELVCLVGLVFLDSELFLDQSIGLFLRKNLELMLARYSGSGTLFSDASRKLETLDITVADFFIKLVEQYEASSYGDENFTKYLLLFITPKSDIIFKKKLFSEKLETCLSQMRVKPHEIWLPLNIFDAHLETDPEIRSLIRLAGPHLVKGSFLQWYRSKFLLK